ncbi:MAG: type II toxin-antitoxin system HicB family antitoxin [Bauldia sp.]
MNRTYAFVFDPDPDGGFVVTCPALPGLVTHGETMDEARAMARDAMEGYIATLIEDGEQVPPSDPPEVAPRYDRLAQSLRDEPVVRLEEISTRIVEAA